MGGWSMLWEWLRPGILFCEGASLGARTMERSYLARYHSVLAGQAARLGMSAEEQATSYGKFQILGENLARHYGITSARIDEYLGDEELQELVARSFFYRQLKRLIRRRGREWPRYLFSLWNSGVHLNPAYDEKMRTFLGVVSGNDPWEGRS